MTLAVASTTGESFTKREEELCQLRIRYPKMNEGELLLEYLERQKIDNPALRMIREITASGDTTKLDELQEEILKLSQKLSTMQGE